jgi:hypothetical protein
MWWAHEVIRLALYLDTCLYVHCASLLVYLSLRRHSHSHVAHLPCSPLRAENAQLVESLENRIPITQSIDMLQKSFTAELERQKGAMEQALRSAETKLNSYEHRSSGGVRLVAAGSAPSTPATASTNTNTSRVPAYADQHSPSESSASLVRRREEEEEMSKLRDM